MNGILRPNRTVAGPLLVDAFWVSLAFAIAGIATRSPLLITLAGALALPLLWRHALPRASESAHLQIEALWDHSLRFHAGDTRSVEIRVSWKGPSPMTLHEVSFHSSPWVRLETAHPEIDLLTGQTRSIHVTVQGLAFGLCRLHALTAKWTPQPGWHSEITRLPIGVSMTVLPARQLIDRLDMTDPIHGRVSQSVTSSSGLSQRSGVSLRELQEHSPGDDPRHVAWRASLRHQRLITQRFDEDGGLAALLVLDGSNAMHAGPPGNAAVDRIASHAQAHAEAFQKAGTPFSVALLQERPTPPSRPSTGPEAAAAMVKWVLRSRHVRSEVIPSETPATWAGMGRALHLSGATPEALQLELQTLGGGPPDRLRQGPLASHDPHVWRIAHGIPTPVETSRRTAPHKAFEALEGWAQQGAWSTIVVITDLSLSPASAPLRRLANTLRESGVGLTILDTGITPPTHRALGHQRATQEARILACLAEERFHASQELCDELRARGATVLGP